MQNNKMKKINKETKKKIFEVIDIYKKILKGFSTEIADINDESQKYDFQALDRHPVDKKK